MPIIKAAKKDLRSSAKKRLFNLRRKRAMTESVKEIKTLAVSGKTDEGKALLSKAYKAIDKAQKRGVIKKNTAARKKSRLSSLLKKTTAVK
ncbi:MAG: 30S ribosomal protein S20 [Candidatus Paceibacterota bacterium]